MNYPSINPDSRQALLLRRHQLAVLVALVVLAGCAFNRLANKAPFEEPTFSYLGYEIRSMTPRQADVDFLITAYNPNAVGLKNVQVDYVLSTEAGSILKGTGLAIDLPPLTDTRINIPTEIRYVELMNVLGPVLERMLITGDYTIPLTIEGNVYGKPTLYDEFEEGTSPVSFNWSFTRSEVIAIPERQIREYLMRMLTNQRLP